MIYSILKENIHKLDWKNISDNPSAIPFLKENLERIDWDCLSSNPNAYELLRENPDKINWRYLSKNKGEAVSIILEDYIFNPPFKSGKKYFQKVDWRELSKNPVIIYLIKRNIDKVCFNKGKVKFLTIPRKFRWKYWISMKDFSCFITVDDFPLFKDYFNVDHIRLFCDNPDSFKIMERYFPLKVIDYTDEYVQYGLAKYGNIDLLRKHYQLRENDGFL